jgi:hypothetical protein
VTRLSPWGVAVLLLVAIEAPASADTVACVAAAEHGQAARDEGRLVAARGAFRLCVQPECPRVVRVDCTRWLSEVDGAIPRMSVRVRPAGANQKKVVVLDDSVEVDASGAPFEVDPGPHTLSFADGSAKVDVVAVSGEPVQAVTLGEEPAVRVSSPPPEPPARAPIFTEPPAVKDEAKGASPTWGAVSLGAGVVSLGVGGTFAVMGWTSWSDLRAGACAGGCSGADADAARSRMLVADVALPLGLLLGGLGVYLLARKP